MIDVQRIVKRIAFFKDNTLVDITHDLDTNMLSQAIEDEVENSGNIELGIRTLHQNLEDDKDYYRKAAIAEELVKIARLLESK